MAFWSAWFKPTCAKCAEKILDEPVEYDGQQLCKGCHQDVLEAEAVRQAEVEARRLAEEEARAKLEGRKAFGTDPRYGEE